jgi:hypothetical protein
METISSCFVTPGLMCFFAVPKVNSDDLRDIFTSLSWAKDLVKNKLKINIVI